MAKKMSSRLVGLQCLSGAAFRPRREGSFLDREAGFPKGVGVARKVEGLV